jgi:predicted transposase YbfD/YdcC
MTPIIFQTNAVCGPFSSKWIISDIPKRAQGIPIRQGNSIYFYEIRYEDRRMNIQRLKEEIAEVSDPRRAYGNFRHKLEDIIIIGLLSTICLGEDFADMEEFGKEREEWLRDFLELPNGIPDSDTFRRVFERLEPGELLKCLNKWIEEQRDTRAVINIDGKTIRGSGNAEHKAYHVVSAWVAENQMTLGQIKVEEKSNEITAVPELLDMLDVEGSIITADAMCCQKAITAKIAERKAEYVIGLKGNQGSLLEDVRLYFDREHAQTFFESLEKGHGRIEKREYFLETDIAWLPQKQEWTNLHAIGAVRSTVDEKSGVRQETRYFITSLTAINDFAYAVRKHWSIENQLHWCLDVIFREDSARARKDNSPLNMNVLRKTALSLASKADLGRKRLGTRKKMLKATLNHDVLLKILFARK